jgi:SAM-dependent methyltransferase
MNEAHEANRRFWDRRVDEWREIRDRDGLLLRLASEPERAFEGSAFQQIEQAMERLAERDGCVIGSGDNYAAFALAGCGGNVTSGDIAQRQLDVAAERALQLGLTIDCVRSDASSLTPILDECFDLVVPTNGFFVWISDPTAVYPSVHRILRPSGHHVFYDIHPFARPWEGHASPLMMKKPYWETGPFVGDGAGFNEYHWTLADLLNPISEVGLVLVNIIESPPVSPRVWFDGRSYEEPESEEGRSDWRNNALAGLPVWLTVTARKL